MARFNWDKVKPVKKPVPIEEELPIFDEKKRRDQTDLADLKRFFQRAIERNPKGVTHALIVNIKNETERTGIITADQYTLIRELSGSDQSRLPKRV